MPVRTPVRAAYPYNAVNQGYIESDMLFYAQACPTYWTKRVTSMNTLTQFQAGATSWVNGSIAADSSPGIHANNFQIDGSYHITTSNSDPVVNVITAGSWSNRSSGSSVVATTHLPSNLIIPDGTQLNNPTTIYNTTTNTYICLNGSARTVNGGPIYGYYSGSTPYTHGGSSMAGGEITRGDLLQGAINHALAIEIWGAKYLNRTTAFVSPALSCDADYNVSSNENYYNNVNGTNMSGIAMGSRFAIPATTTLASLGLSGSVATMLYNALVLYGCYVVDNSAGDYLNVCVSYPISDYLFGYASTFLQLVTALEICT